MHGIELRREPTEGGTGSSGAAEVRIWRISVCYEDGRVTSFIPEAVEEFFSKDNVDRPARILYRSSEGLELSQMSDRIPDGEQGRGLL